MNSGEWSRKEPISFPLWRQKERDDVSERKRTMAKDLCMISRRPEATAGRVSRRGNVTPASSGRVDGPAACRARRGPDGVRGVVDFCDPAKIRDIPGLPTGGIPSRRQLAGRETGNIHSLHRFRPAEKRATSLLAGSQWTIDGIEALQNPPNWCTFYLPVGRI